MGIQHEERKPLLIVSKLFKLRKISEYQRRRRIWYEIFILFLCWKEKPNSAYVAMLMQNHLFSLGFLEHSVVFVVDTPAWPNNDLNNSKSPYLPLIKLTDTDELFVSILCKPVNKCLTELFLPNSIMRNQGLRKWFCYFK